jgi:hypothetical protein
MEASTSDTEDNRKGIHTHVVKLQASENITNSTKKIEFNSTLGVD